MAQKSPRCVNLGDCHQGNTYVMPDGERVWLDWQLVRKGRPWRDLTYFTIGALRLKRHAPRVGNRLPHNGAPPVERAPKGFPTPENSVRHIEAGFIKGFRSGLEKWVLKGKAEGRGKGGW